MLGTRTTRWTVGTALLCVLLVAAAWLLLIGPRRSEAADLAEKDLSTQQQNQQLETRIEELKAQSAQLSTYRAELAGVLKQLPPTAQLPQLVRDLHATAAATGVTLDILTPGTAVALASAGPGSKPAGSSTAGTTGSAGSAGTAGSAGSAGSATSSEVMQIPLTVAVHGDYFQAVAFLQKLQTQLSRAFLVNAVEVKQFAAGGSGAIQLTITGAVFAWPSGALSAPTTGSTGPTAVAGPTAATVPPRPSASTSSSASTGGTR
jgi:Tfp pilus assembly protein PilO